MVVTPAQARVNESRDHLCARQRNRALQGEKKGKGHEFWWKVPWLIWVNEHVGKQIPSIELTSYRGACHHKNGSDKTCRVEIVAFAWMCYKCHSSVHISTLFFGIFLMFSLFRSSPQLCSDIVYHRNPVRHSLAYCDRQWQHARSRGRFFRKEKRVIDSGNPAHQRAFVLYVY